jgi:hypothetical protein
MQKRNPVGSGPSGNTWPRWASQTLHITSTRTMPKAVSFSYFIAFVAIGSVKLGQPDLLSNLIEESKRGVLQQMQ